MLYSVRLPKALKAIICIIALIVYLDHPLEERLLYRTSLLD